MTISVINNTDKEEVYVEICNGNGVIAIQRDVIEDLMREEDNCVWDCVRRGLRDGLLYGVEDCEPANIICVPDIDTIGNTLNINQKNEIIRITDIKRVKVTHRSSK